MRVWRMWRRQVVMRVRRMSRKWERERDCVNLGLNKRQRVSRGLGCAWGGQWWRNNSHATKKSRLCFPPCPRIVVRCVIPSQSLVSKFGLSFCWCWEFVPRDHYFNLPIDLIHISSALYFCLTRCLLRSFTRAYDVDRVWVPCSSSRKGICRALFSSRSFQQSVMREGTQFAFTW